MFENNRRKEGLEESKLLIAKLKDKIELSKKQIKLIIQIF